MRRRRWQAVLGLWAAGVALGLWVDERAAHAQSAANKAAAQALFDEGKKLYDAKSYTDACARFDASEKLDPGLGTRLYLADCYEHVGRIASAWAMFREAESLAKEAQQADRERVARERAARLEPNLYRLTVTVAATPPGLKVMRGDVEVVSETFGTGLPVDPGTYALTATAPGKRPYTIQVQVPAGSGAQTVNIPALEEDPAARAAAEAAKTASIPPIAGPVPPPPEVPEVPGHKQRVGAIVVGSIGLAALGVAGALAGVAASDFSTAKSDCPKTPCTNRTGVDLATTAGTLADGATGLFVAGGVAAAAGVVLFVTAPRAQPGKPTAWVAPLLTMGATPPNPRSGLFAPGTVGLMLGGGF